MVQLPRADTTSSYIRRCAAGMYEWHLVCRRKAVPSGTSCVTCPLRHLMITSPFSRVPSRGHIRPTDPSTSVRDHVVAEIHPYLPRGTRRAGGRASAPCCAASGHAWPVRAPVALKRATSLSPWLGRQAGPAAQRLNHLLASLPVCSSRGSSRQSSTTTGAERPTQSSDRE